MDLKIFDTLIHSGISPLWPSKPTKDIKITNIITLINQEKLLKGALVQTSPWFDTSNSIELFYKFINSNKGPKHVIPVATIPFLSFEKIKSFIRDAIDIGFTVFKIHPRFSKHSQKDLEIILDYILPKAHLVQVCTYQNQEIKDLSNLSDRNNLIELLAYKSNLYSKPVMLMHAFDVSILKAHSVVRHNKYLILDLSMTILKYDQSSIDNDIIYLFKHFDRRISVGSDYPEWSFEQLERKLKILGEYTTEDKLKNILYNNVEEILSF
tara:strand:+ start:1637 stop:2437 length:801 start_codon:yes stop_codon:yes gene_type:complete